jgi:hypothetical protein
MARLAARKPTLLLEFDEGGLALGTPDQFQAGIIRRTAGELVKHMTTHGLRFAPAAPSSEAVYNALYKALVVYDLGLVQKQADRP